MASLSNGDYMLSNVQWRKREEEAALRPLRGFTTGTLSVGRSRSNVEARFTDQNLSNRFSSMEEDEVAVTLQVTLLGDDEIYLVPGWAPTLELSGAAYVIQVRGKTSDLEEIHPVG